MYQPRDVAEIGRRLHERMHGLARGSVDRGHAHFVSRVPHDLGRCFRVVWTHIGKYDMFPDPDSPRDCLTDQTCSNDDNYIFHMLCSMFIRTPTPSICRNLSSCSPSRWPKPRGRYF